MKLLGDWSGTRTEMCPSASPFSCQYSTNVLYSFVTEDIQFYQLTALLNNTSECSGYPDNARLQTISNSPFINILSQTLYRPRY